MSDTYLVDKAVRLFTFLAKAQQLKAAPVRDFESYQRDGAVHWLDALPVTSAVRWQVTSEDDWDEGPLVSIDRLVPPETPLLPPELVGWVAGRIEDATVRPTLAEARWTPEGRMRQLADHPEIAQAFDEWIVEWDAWSEVFRREQPVRDAYAALFKLYVQATQKSEELELLLGVGLLTWAPSGHERMRRHLFTTPVNPKLEEANGQLDFFLDESSVGLRTELDMLDLDLIPDQSMVRNLEQKGSSFEGSPLDPAAVRELGRPVALQLHNQGVWDDDASLPETHEYPVVAWAPALILRPRNRTGLVQSFLDIAKQIGEVDAVPAGLRPLIEPDELPPVTTETRPGAILTFEDEMEVVAPLPLNEVQRRILERVDRHAQTLVQGPPGTGKTHTAAALLAHLLAQGQRVLVTAHTDRALREVRSKLPDQIKPLAVSVIGASRDDLADLRTAVDEISRRAGDYDQEQTTQEIQHQLDIATQLDEQRRKLGWQLVAAREQEVTEHNHRGYEGTLTAIAQQYQAAATEFSWIEDLIQFGPETQAPLSTAEALEWLSLLRDQGLVEDAEQSQRRRLPSQELPTAAVFAEQVTAESATQTALETFADVNDHPSLPRLRAIDGGQRAALQGRLRRILDSTVGLGQPPLQWVGQAVRDVLGGVCEVWRARAAELAAGIGRVEAMLQYLPAGTRIEFLGRPSGARAMAASLLRYLQQGGSLRTRADGTVKIGFFSPRVVKDCRSLLEGVRVNGQPPTTQATLSAVAAYHDAWDQILGLDQTWPAGVQIPPEDTLRERVEWHRIQLGQLQKILGVGEQTQAEGHFLRQCGVASPRWVEPASIEQLVRLLDALAAADDLAAAREPLRYLEEQLAAVAQWADAAGAVGSLSQAVVGRDREAYAAARKRLEQLEQAAAGIDRRSELTERVRSCCPELAASVTATHEDPVWDDRLSRLEAAFEWGAVGAWVLAQKQIDANTIQDEIADKGQQLRDTAQTIAALRAWGHAVGSDRLTPGRRADLRSYSQQVTRLGKGTGKYAAQQRAAVRRSMERCRPAVPVWIMPIYRVAEQFHMEENMFDVVVVDEASQAGLEATFLQYLAPKIVVIGDDKQVSPAAVGVNQQQLRDLAAQYLHDDRYKDTWLDPQRSLFDEAAMRYGGQLTLVEHRRCVPEIIGFSNRIAYEPNGIRLVPVRQFGADRLAPFYVQHVPDGVAQGKVNQAEAQALVADLKSCLEDPAYDDASMAVISLVGDQQARYIESLLLEEVSAEEWSRRSLRVGTAPDFQGSERDVVFLSMVSMPEPGKKLRALTGEMYVQRFNVAVSRAKDQVRLFHSATLNDIPNSEDLRHQLLDYAYGVVQRSQSSAGGACQVVPEDDRVEPFDSLFEQRVFNRIVDRGFTVQPQVGALGYRIDLVIVGARAKLAVECDGDAWHGPDVYEKDLARQRELERCGWKFFRIRESTFYVSQAAALAPLWDLLDDLEIRPSGWIADGQAEEAVKSS